MHKVNSKAQQCVPVLNLQKLFLHLISELNEVTILFFPQLCYQILLALSRDQQSMDNICKSIPKTDTIYELWYKLATF